MAKIKPFLYFFYLGIEAILYVLILFVPLPFMANNILCFSTVALSAIFAWIYLEQKPFFILTAALSFTALADFFLECVEPQEQVISISFFFVVQMLYALYIMFFSHHAENIIHLSVHAATLIVCGIIAALVLGPKLDYLSLVSFLYFASLLINLVFAFLHVKEHPYLAFGLLLFVLCDVTVGLATGIKEGYLQIDNSFIRGYVFSPFYFILLFYTPSQVLLFHELYRGQKKTEPHKESGLIGD